MPAAVPPSATLVPVTGRLLPTSDWLKAPTPPFVAKKTLPTSEGSSPDSVAPARSIVAVVVESYTLLFAVPPETVSNFGVMLAAR
ncbi:hypothetical protein QFZ99_003840 [Paraburkholderia atlantica]